MNNEVYNQMVKVAARGDYLLKSLRPQLNKSLEEYGRTTANKPIMQIISGLARKNEGRHTRGARGLVAGFGLPPEDVAKYPSMGAQRSEAAGDFWKDRRKKQGL